MGALALLLAGCPGPVASEDTSSGGTTEPDPTTESSSNTGALPTTGDAAGTSSTSDASSTTDSTGTTDPTGTTGPVDATTGETETGTTGTTTGDTTPRVDTTGDESSGGGPAIDPPPGCDAALVHVGDLDIGDATDLDALKCLVEVTGRLRIRDTTQLVSFPQLANLQRVGDDVEVFDNLALVDLDGFAGLKRVEGQWFSELHLYHNPALTSLAGLAALREIDAVLIQDNDSLTDLTGLTGDLDGILFPGWYLAVFGNDALTDLEGLAGIVDLDRSVYIGDNLNLTDISTLATVLSPTILEVSISGNPALPDLQGLEGLVAPQVVYITDNDALVDLTGLDSLQSAVPHGILIEGNAQLQSLAGLESLTTVAKLIVEDNPALASVAALSGLQTVTKNLQFGVCGGVGNDALVDLHGLEQLTALNGLSVNQNDALQSITAVPHGVGLKGIEAFNNPLLPTAMILDYAAEGMLDPDLWVCNNADAPEVCACNEILD